VRPLDGLALHILSIGIKYAVFHELVAAGGRMAEPFHTLHVVTHRSDGLALHELVAADTAYLIPINNI